MGLRNRVRPDGQITNDPTRGLFTGNRGILHTHDKVMGPAQWKHRAWICCTLDWQNRTRDVMTGRNWTELFFLDEAVALAAGHRPCAYCRRDSYNQFTLAWGERLKAPQMDARLHAARAVNGARRLRTHDARAETLPDYTFVQTDTAMMLRGDHALPYTPTGYGAPVSRPTGRITLLTSPVMVDVLRGGYVPHLHPSAS